MQETLDSGEEEKRSRRSMQAKLVRLEGDLSASEASHVHEAELKNKLGRIRRSNIEYQRKVRSLVQEIEDLTRKTQLNGKQEVGDSTVNREIDIQSKTRLMETMLADALEENKIYKAQRRSPIPEEQSAGGDRILQLEGDVRDMKDWVNECTTEAKLQQRNH